MDSSGPSETEELREDAGWEMIDIPEVTENEDT
jgi:hypothetical protein